MCQSYFKNSIKKNIPYYRHFTEVFNAMLMVKEISYIYYVVLKKNQNYLII